MLLEVGDVIELRGKDGNAYKGPGYYYIAGSRPLLNQIVDPDATNFADWFQIADTNVVKQVVLDNNGPLDLRPRKDELFELVFGIRSKFGGARVWLTLEQVQQFINSRNTTPQTSKYKKQGYISGADSPFENPSEDTKFYLTPATPPTFYTNVATANDTVQLKILGRAHIPIKVDGNSDLMKKIRALDVLPKLITCTETQYQGGV